MIAKHPDLSGELVHIPFDPETPDAASGWRHDPAYNKKTKKMDPEVVLSPGSLSHLK